MYLHHPVAMMTSEYDIRLQGIAPEFACSPMRKLHKHWETSREDQWKWQMLFKKPSVK